MTLSQSVSNARTKSHGQYCDALVVSISTVLLKDFVDHVPCDFSLSCHFNVYSCHSLGSIFRVCTIHCSILVTSLSTSSKVLPECRQTLTLCPPSGTVGGTIGLTINPPSWQNFAKLRGCGVNSEKIGDWGWSGGICNGGTLPFSASTRSTRVCNRA